MTSTSTKLLALLACSALLSGCAPSTPGPAQPAASAPAGGATPATNAAGEWKPSEGCPPVPVPDGDFDLIGDPRACKGGRINLETNSYPTHLAYYGPERDTNIEIDYGKPMLLPLVNVNLNTFAVMPWLAASWEETLPQQEFVFHIEPDAKWSDGTPVTSKDVIATYDLIETPEIAEVLLKQEMDKWERPVAVDDKTVRWKAKNKSWRNLIVLTDIVICPAHLTNPKTYLDDWKFEPKATDGPYTLGPHETGQYIEMVRNKGWWGEGKRQFVGLYNFDVIHHRVIENNDIAFETMKKGDIDYFLISRAQRWIEETEFDKIQKGWIQKQKMYMREPQAASQTAFNLTDPLFTDVRVRKALFWLYNRELLHDQLFYHQYTNKQSYFANSVYANPDNEKITFDPEKGLELLAEAGWTQKDSEGYLVKDGKRLEFDYIYIHSDAARVYTPLQETYRKYGVKMNLKLIQPSAWVKISESKDFQTIYANWGSTPYPQPRDLWHSEFADKIGSSNITHFKNAEADSLIEQYELEPDMQKRIELMRKLDAILWRECPYILDWYSDNYRNLWWDKFGMPSWVSWAGYDIRFTNWQCWWYDEARAKRLEEAMKADRPVPRPPAESTAWKLP